MFWLFSYGLQVPVRGQPVLDSPAGTGRHVHFLRITEACASCGVPPVEGLSEGKGPPKYCCTSTGTVGVAVVPAGGWCVGGGAVVPAYPATQVLVRLLGALTTFWLVVTAAEKQLAFN